MSTGLTHLDTLAKDNEIQKQHILRLEKELASLARNTAREEDRKNKLSALRTTALLRFARVHAEEETSKRYLAECRKGIEDAWSKIQSFQERLADLMVQKSREEVIDAKIRKRRADHFEDVERVLKEANLGAEVLEAECSSIVAALKTMDEKQAQEEAAAAAAQEAQRVADAEAEAEALRAQQEAQAIDNEVAPADDGTSQQELIDEELDNAVLSVLSSLPCADRTNILQALPTVDASSAHVDMSLERLKAAFLIYESGPGPSYASM